MDEHKKFQIQNWIAELGQALSEVNFALQHPRFHIVLNGIYYSIFYADTA